MQALAEAAVAKWPLRPLRIELAAQRENAVFRVDAEEGVFALRLHRQRSEERRVGKECVP